MRSVSSYDDRMGTKYDQNSSQADAEMEDIQAALSKADDRIDELKERLEMYEQQLLSASSEQKREDLTAMIDEVEAAISEAQQEFEEASSDLSRWQGFWMEEED